MLTVTLLTSPNAPALEPVLSENLRNAWGGTDVDWLSPGEAAEFRIPSLPNNQWEIWAGLQKMKVDLVIQPTGHRKKSILIADMDSTIIEQECIDELAAEAGLGAKISEITTRAMNGELDFETALIERVSMLQGLDREIVEKVLRNRITLMPGAKTLLATMKSQGTYCALVSGGFTEFTGKIAADLAFDEHRANTLLFENNTLTGNVGQPILGREAKVAALNNITAQLNLNSDNVIAVGDGANDLGMLKLAGTGVALHAKPSVAAKTNIRINHGDLTALLFLQGYRRTDFVS